MTTLLIVIYLTFIGLGLPDSLFGAAWPTLHLQIGAPETAAGLVSMIVSGGTVVSSLLSARVIRRFRTGPVTLVSVLMTAIAQIGYALAPSLGWLCLCAVPLGLGAGAIDAALNNFVALHYAAIHMNWLHCFWGVGVTISPLIMGAALRGSGGWRRGYWLVTALLFLLALVLAWVQRNWRRVDNSGEMGGEAPPLVSNSQALRIPGVRFALLAFLCYCGFETTAGLWLATYLVNVKGVAAAAAASWAAMYYGGITAGRFISGFFAIKLSSATLIRISCGLCLVGAALLLLPLPLGFTLAGLPLIGLGAAPFYPAMIHETPARFGQSASQAVIGLEMACAYVGSTFMPALLGLVSGWATLKIWPWFLLALIIGMTFFSEKIPSRAGK